MEIWRRAISLISPARTVIMGWVRNHIRAQSSCIQGKHWYETRLVRERKGAVWRYSELWEEFGGSPHTHTQTHGENWYSTMDLSAWYKYFLLLYRKHRLVKAQESEAVALVWHWGWQYLPHEDVVRPVCTVLGRLYQIRTCHWVCLH